MRNLPVLAERRRPFWSCWGPALSLLVRCFHPAGPHSHSPPQGMPGWPRVGIDKYQHTAGKGCLASDMANITLVLLSAVTCILHTGCWRDGEKLNSENQLQLGLEIQTWIVRYCYLIQDRGTEPHQYRLHSCLPNVFLASFPVGYLQPTTKIEKDHGLQKAWEWSQCILTSGNPGPYCIASEASFLRVELK